MKTFERRIQVLGRFAVGLGIGLALTSAYVIVVNGRAFEEAKPLEVIRLDPIVVTISNERFAELRAEAVGAEPKLHLYDRGAQRVDA